MTNEDIILGDAMAAFTLAHGAYTMAVEMGTISREAAEFSLDQALLAFEKIQTSPGITNGAAFERARERLQSVLVEIPKLAASANEAHAKAPSGMGEAMYAAVLGEALLSLLVAQGRLSAADLASVTTAVHAGQHVALSALGDRGASMLASSTYARSRLDKFLGWVATMPVDSHEGEA